MAKKKVIEIDIDTLQSKTAIGQIVELFKKLYKVEVDAEEQAKKTEKAVEDVGKGASKARKGVKVLTSGFKNLAKAIAVSGVGLFVGLLALLKGAFEGNEKVQKAFGIGMEYLNAVVGELVDIIDDAVTKIADTTNGFESLGAVMKGLMTLAILPLKLAFLGIGKGIAQAQLLWEKSFFGGNDQDKIKELEESIMGYNVSIVKAGVDAVEAGKSIVKNFGGAISEVGELGKAVVDGLGEVEIQSSILRNRQDKEDKEAKKKAEKRRKLAEKKRIAEEDAERKRIAGNKKKLLEIEKSYIEEKEDLDAVSRQTQLDLEKQRAIEDLENLKVEGDEFDKAKLALETAFKEKQILLNAEIKAENDQKDADNYKKNLGIKKKNQEKELADEKAVQNAKIGLANQSFQLLGALAEEGSALAKGVQVAQTIMSTIQGVQSAYTSAQASPYTTVFPGYPLVQAGFAGAFGALSVQKILSTPTKSSGGGGAPSVGGGGGGGSAPPPAFNLVGGSGVDEIGGTLSTETEPVKAYVVGADVTNQQEIDNAQAESASLG